MQSAAGRPPGGMQRPRAAVAWVPRAPSPVASLSSGADASLEAVGGCQGPCTPLSASGPPAAHSLAPGPRPCTTYPEATLPVDCKEPCMGAAHFPCPGAA